MKPNKTSPSQSENEQVVDLGEIRRIIWQGKWLVGAITAVFVSAGFYYAFVLAVPMYSATTVVMLETQQESVVDLQSVVGGLSGDTSAVNSEVEVLRSRTARGYPVQSVIRLQLRDRGVSGVGE